MTSSAATQYRVQVFSHFLRSPICFICRAGLQAQTQGKNARGFAAKSTKEEAGDKQRVHDSMRSESKSTIVRRISLPTGLSKRQDPLKLANHTLSLLQKGDRRTALQSVRAASKEGRCTVSWNHIINDQMRAGRVQSAFHDFTEMRKRGQKPDSYTYTILFRGLAEHVKKSPTAVERALTLFGSLQGPNSAVPILTAHVNAAIEVCAKARKIDAIYGIAARLPEKGPGAPDHMTYTIILECLRSLVVQQSRNRPQNDTQGVLERSRSEHILQGKRLWADVKSRWSMGTLTMDEILVDAMGRLLLLGTTQNFDEVLSLVAQTTNIPREIPSIGSADRKTNLKSDSPTMAAPTEDEVQGLTQREVSSLDISNSELALAEQASRGLFEPTNQSLRLHLLAKPRNRTLSLLMRACGGMNAYGAAQRYWDTITAHVAPDLQNFHEYLRVLRAQRNSRLVVELVRQICVPKEQDGFGLTPNAATFRIAMSACVRDGNNRRCLDHARTLLRYQAQYLAVPDVQTALILTEMLLQRNGQWPLEEVAPTMDELETMWVNLKHLTAYGQGEAENGRLPSLKEEVSRDTRNAMRDLTTKYYRLIDLSMAVYREKLGEDTFRLWNQRLSRNRNKIHRDKMRQREQWFLEGRQANTEELEQLQPQEQDISHEGGGQPAKDWAPLNSQNLHRGLSSATN